VNSGSPGGNVVAKVPQKNIVIVAGGTGGHVYPAMAVALELRQRGYEIHWLGTAAGLEARVVPAAGIELVALQVKGLRGKGLGAKIQGLVFVCWALLQALGAMRRLQPLCVLGMGGYVAGPVGLASRMLRKPLLIHEQNSVAGTTNRILSRFASRVFTAYPAAFNGTIEAIMVGNPVRSEMLDRGARSSYDYDGGRPLKLLVIGGSLGARAINEVLPETMGLLASTCPLQLRHQTGPAHGDAVRAAYQALDKVAVEVLSYIEDMAEAYAWADLVLCRAGALTLAELTVMGRPSVLVPLPGAIDNHQFYNAKWLVGQGAALLLPQSELSPAALAKLLAQLVEQPAQLAEMAQAARRAARLDATTRIADICEEVQRERS
jgi:UDP-N-acetylglucosamine--N-acetylmuramyl-(pentapeptide) pyrophosphoryl-undecaprenol N-acetylglucosamine transferase